MVCVPVAAPSRRTAASLLARACAAADIVELRLDLFDEPFDLPALLQARTRPAIVTLRPPPEGGRCALPDVERIALLERAGHLGAEYVDVEASAASSDVVARLRATGARVIVSRHDFQSMPEGFVDRWLPEMLRLEPDAVKLVGMARDPLDCLPPIRALRRADRPCIALGMGERGVASRVLALREDRCLLTFATLAAGEGTAPGQVPVEDLREVYRAERLRLETRVFGVLGCQVDRSTLRRLNGWFHAAELDAVAVPFPTDGPAAPVIRGFRELPVSGWYLAGEGVRPPAGETLDVLRSSALHRGAANTIYADGEALVGEWAGSLEEVFALWTGHAPPLSPQDAGREATV